MNEATRKKLESNPHYKLSAKQKKEIREENLNRKPMVEFGTPPVHQNRIEPQFETHPTNVVKIDRTRK